MFFERLDDLQFNALLKFNNEQDFILKLVQNVQKFWILRVRNVEYGNHANRNIRILESEILGFWSPK